MNSSNNFDKLIITQEDKEILNKINLNRDLFKDGIVCEAIAVSIRIWIPDNYSEGVIDIAFPVSEDNSFGFKDRLEAIVSKDSIGVYRLFNRGANKDIPKHFYSIIENKILIPVSMGNIVPYCGHVYGKGIIYKVAKMKAREFRLLLEDVEIISPFENAKFSGDENNESLPKSYEKVKKIPDDYNEIINKGENENVEFKSSARWDFKLNCNNKELQRMIIKSIAGFLNLNGGILFIGVDDNKKILGIQDDLNTLKKKNIDGYMLFITELISDKIGKQFNQYIFIEFPIISEKTICVLKIDKSITAAFVKENDKSIFYLRVNNSTRELDSKETLEYVLKHFKE